MHGCYGQLHEKKRKNVGSLKRCNDLLLVVLNNGTNFWHILVKVGQSLNLSVASPLFDAHSDTCIARKSCVS